MTAEVHVHGSLRRRLGLILTGGAAVLAVILYLAVRTFAAQIAQQGQDSILNASVTSILDTAVLRDGEVLLDFPYASLSMLGTSADDRVFYAIHADDRLLSGYDSLPAPGASQDSLPRFRTTDHGGEPVRMATDARTLIGAQGQTTVTVSVAQTQDALSETLNAISRRVALFGIGFFALSTALALWAAATTSRQLRRLTTSVTRRGPQDLRPVAQPVPSEMGPLVASLNTLMGRLDHALTRSEEFLAEAAHRVRTPLATVRAYAETTLQRVDNPDNRKALHAMIRAIDESSRAASQLLDHAMVTFRADTLTREDLELSELLRDLVDRMRPVADMKDITLSLRAEGPAVLHGDAILLQNALRNLIDNALKYAPAETRVEVAVRSEGAGPVVTVIDEGPGFDAAEIDTLATRFVRGKAMGHTIGSGLGLTIVQAVVLAHGATMTLSNTAEGGACVTLQF
ncbi:sensor histidine kinase [Thalassorhabdomicrobium marinisediminis]|uniref:histidine kinase n=1 Tax=Thalassorhabdomicrobium marinisediminis TaxID=2170577 RepID=A0A2T7FT99_9RHOB|nr:sensor histidine kinase [Thalassorhabdomicrobium marinisediminis]PVA05397.1 HAMP domain-containing histidine kinase [Thalassorhabdomicrobium marinisediminis]